MDKKKFRVEISSGERTIYLIEAPDSEAAKRLAIDRWQAGAASDISGFGWQELESAHVAEARDAADAAQDDVVMLRFVRERERLLIQFGASTQGGADAISAAQAALDLGWVRPTSAGGLPDAVRAAESLERLNARRLLISFDRTRVRAGERGEIRLYCTVEYLERLEAAVEDGSKTPAGRESS